MRAFHFPDGQVSQPESGVRRAGKSAVRSGRDDGPAETGGGFTRKRGLGSGEGRVEMEQAVRVGWSVGFSGFPGRIAHHAEPGSERGSGPMPTGKPAVSAGQGHGEPGRGPGRVPRGCEGEGPDERQKLDGTSRRVGQDVVPIDREGPSAAYVRVAVRAKKRRPRVTVSWPDCANPRR